MAYLGYKNIAFRKHMEHMAEVRRWKEEQKAKKRKAKQTKKLLKTVAAHVFIAIVLITIYYLL